MFSKFTSILQHAVEALAPSLPLQEDFVYHWKAITHYYIETSDDKAPVTDTNIPSHLEQMLDILVQEENERESGETGPCMEYLLHHKILETLYTLGKADCPPGMKQQVLVFYTKLLGRIRQPLLPHINVHRPVQDGRIAVKACEGLMLLVSLPEPAAAKCLTQSTCLCELLTDRLASLYKALPQSVDPLDIETVEAINWGLDSYSHKEDASAFPGKRALISFLSWFDYCDQLIKEAQKTAAVALAKAVHERFFIGVMEPQLMQTSEMGILTSTALLHRIVRQVTSDVLLQEMVFFILGEQREPETVAEISRHPLRHRLIEHCDHISDEISIMTLRMFEHLLQKPNEHILYNLVLRNLEERNYTECKPLCPEDKDVVENGLIAGAVFLCLVPDDAKSSYHVEGTGYDTYLRDAHRQFRDYCAICLRWEWPGSPKALEKCNLEAAFFEGHFLKVLFDRMGRILDQPYDVNLQVTSVLSRLSLFPHPHIHEYLLDPYVNLAPGCRSLFSVIVRVVGDLMLRIQRIQDFTPKLLLVRKRLLGLEPEGPLIDHITLLEGVIVLEEFCKELAAIAFVKYHASSTP
ncbi:hypothetical protein H8958_021522 [Nasalis larvatus]